jgi:hypothetical protein
MAANVGGAVLDEESAISLHFLLEIDLSDADVEIFERYEELALAVLEEHGGLVVARVRDVAERREWHLLRLPNQRAWDSFRSDPRRIEHAWLLERANVVVARHDVRPVP